MSDPDPNIRRARTDDAPIIAELITALGYDTTPDEMTQRLAILLEDANYVTVVAEVSGTVVGVAGGVVEHRFERDGRAARLLVISVTDGVRGRGIGRQLVRAVEDWARACGASEIVVHSGAQRTEAHRFYTREGYGRMGLRFVKPLT